MSTVFRLTRTRHRVPKEVLAADIFRIARVICDTTNLRGIRLAARVRDEVINMYPEVSFQEFRRALAYLRQFLHDD